MPQANLNRYLPFLIWLVASGSYWHQLASHFPIALAMLFGSYIAGSTPMGGGTVGFPVLVLVFDMPSSLGRNFGLAIQSIGMVSASVFILCKRSPIEWKLLRGALVGSLLGTPFGAIWIAPHISDLAVKLIFAVIWASFGLMHLVKISEIARFQGLSASWQSWDLPIGFSIGVLGGIVASITGVGIDMIIYVVLVMLYRADLKIAIPTSVILMAFTSIVGITTNLLLAHFWPVQYQVDLEVFYSWLAASPVVAIGAPFGAFVVSLIPRAPTMIIVSLLCLVQYVWTVVHEQVSGTSLVVSLLGIAFMNWAFIILYRLGSQSQSGECSR